MHLDIKVLIVFGIVFILSFGLLGYSIIQKNKAVPCQRYEVLIYGQRNTGDKIYYTNEPLLFRVPANISDKVVWDFGDNSLKTESIGTRHAYTEEKTFFVTATINGKCASETIKVNIRKKENTITDTLGNVMQSIIGETDAMVREPVTFTTPLNANSYTWSVNKSGYPIFNSKSATFKFKDGGTFTVILIVDNDRQKKYEHTIRITAPTQIDSKIPDVKIPDNSQQTTKETEAQSDPGQNQQVNPPAPEPPKPKPSKTLTIDETLKDHIQNYLCGFKTLDQLEQYFCDLNNTPVTAVNEKNKKINTTMANLCAALGCNKDINIINLTADRSKDQCVTSVYMKYEKVKRKKACQGN